MDVAEPTRSRYRRLTFQADEDQEAEKQAVRRKNGVVNNTPFIYPLLEINQSKKMWPELNEEREDERTPLLASSVPSMLHHFGESSLVGESTVGRATTTVSEGGPLTSRKRRKKARRRPRANSLNALERTIRRPFIATGFMPMPSQVSVEGRRPVQLVTNRVGGIGYGAVRRVHESLQRTANDGEGGPLPSGSGSSGTETEEDEDEEEDESSPNSSGVVPFEKRRLSSLSRKEWATIGMLAAANLASTVAFSCIAPFFPGEAKLKGLNESQTGIIFGIFELVMFVSAPLFGKYIGSKRMFTFGLVMTALTAVLFGFLNYLPAGNLFFAASLLIRCAEAVGDAAFVTSSFVISARCFPGRLTFVIGILETFAGLGYTAGPLIGGVLYEYGGFQLPFLVLGVCLFIVTGASCFLVESSKDEPAEDPRGMIDMLRIPSIWIMAYAIIVCAISLSFLDPTLAAHLESFKLTPTLVGLMFLLCGGLYTLSAPLWGVLVDRWNCADSLMFLGSLATIVAMILIGPSPFMPFDKDLIVIGVALSVLGVAAGALYIPIFQNCLDAVMLRGFEDSHHTYGLVSGVFQSSFALGSFVGPTLGGVSVQWVGFEWTVTAIAFIHLIFIVTFLIFHGCRKLRGSGEGGYAAPSESI